LLEASSDDQTVPAFDSRGAFVALRRFEKEATFVEYAGEGHILTKESNQIDFSNRVLDWFAKYLGS